eukprot:s1634_g14.t1
MQACFAPDQGIDVQVSHVFSVEYNKQKRDLLLQEHASCQHVFSDVEVFATGRGWCYRCNREHDLNREVAPIDVFICGPSCKDLSKLNTGRIDLVGCYDRETTMEETPFEGTSSKTYTLGFRKVAEDFAPSMAFYENVRGAIEKAKDAKGRIQPAPVEACTSRHEKLVKIAQKAFPGKQNLFIDCASSLWRPTHSDEVCPCLTPEHPIYSTLLKRYLGPADHLNLQGIFETAISKETYNSLMDDPKLCQDLCGNSFTSTTFQAVFLSALAVGGPAWHTVGCQPLAPQGQPKQLPLRRCRFKRPAPEFDEEVAHVSHPKRRKTEENKPVPAEHIARGEECSYHFAKQTLKSAIEQWNDVVGFIRGKEREELLEYCELPEGETDVGHHLEIIQQRISQQLLKISLKDSSDNFLSPGGVMDRRYNGQLVANFDQIWSLCYSPATRTLVQKPKAPDDLARKMSLRRVRHCIERVLGKEYTENMDDSREVVVPEGQGGRIQGGTAAYSPVDGYRIPRTLTSLSWADGTLGRGYVCCRADCITEQQRSEANKD